MENEILKKHLKAQRKEEKYTESWKKSVGQRENKKQKVLERDMNNYRKMETSGDSRWWENTKRN